VSRVANATASANRQCSKDENRDLFEHVKETLVKHLPDDDLDRFSLSMIPDLVMGLRVSSDVPHNDDYFPVKRTRILLPFLVLEAKKDSGSPSFRSIQHQTAFPIRRFLLAQEEMYSKVPVGSSEPCLVWFFSNRGELWRLTACTREAATVVCNFPIFIINWSNRATSEIVRSMARHYTVAGWCSSASAHRGLHLVMGSRRLSAQGSGHPQVHV